MHECERVLGDRLVSEVDQAKFGEFRTATIRKFFGDLRLVSSVCQLCRWLWPHAQAGAADGARLHKPHLCLHCIQQEDIEAAPLLFNSFMARDANELPVYMCASSADALKRALEDKLAEYNENNPGGQGIGGFVHGGPTCAGGLCQTLFLACSLLFMQ